MAASPKIKIYRKGEYVASCKYFEDAAALVAVSGGTVKYHHGGKILWMEGKEDFPAGESYDRAAQVMHERANRGAFDKAKA